MTIQIIEILRRSEHGVTRPFICRADDGNTYFVKGKGAGRSSLLAEYICGKMAQKFGLPIADFEIVEVDEALIRAAVLPEVSDLGAGLAFGSKALPHVQELQFPQLAQISTEICKDILVFDWWVHNQDRTLSAQGGNPNLLWDQSSTKLVVIDHNVALELAFDKINFSQNHVFANLIPTVFEDFAERAIYEQRLQEAFSEFDVACQYLPKEWWWAGDGVPANFDRNAVRVFLNNINQPEFWRVAK